jgi:hypothetical protein
MKLSTIFNSGFELMCDKNRVHIPVMMMSDGFDNEDLNKLVIAKYKDIGILSQCTV